MSQARWGKAIRVVVCTTCFLENEKKEFGKSDEKKKGGRKEKWGSWRGYNYVFLETHTNGEDQIWAKEMMRKVDQNAMSQIN